MGALVVAVVLGSSAAYAAADPYAPLQLYAGKWAMTDASGKTISIDNHCARTGLFYVCEQVVGGKSEDLIVFLPTGSTAAGLTYRTQALTADGARTHPWQTLTIDGDHWIYVGDPERPGGPHSRTLNRFSGANHIHFDVQTSADGKIWTTTLGGEEQREP
ncbi:MAG: hypothetical protein ABI056_07410 [Caulobacteraceae bacterium]